MDNSNQTPNVGAGDSNSVNQAQNVPAQETNEPSLTQPSNEASMGAPAEVPMPPVSEPDDQSIEVQPPQPEANAQSFVVNEGANMEQSMPQENTPTQPDALRADAPAENMAMSQESQMQQSQEVPTMQETASFSPNQGSVDQTGAMQAGMATALPKKSSNLRTILIVLVVAVLISGVYLIYQFMNR